MKIDIEIRDRLYQEIKSVCNANSMNIDDYLSKLIEDGYYLDKYGDLNDVVIKKDVKSNEETPTKTVETPSESIKEDNSATMQEEAQNVAETKEEPKEKEIQTVKKTKRTLKSK